MVVLVPKGVEEGVFPWDAKEVEGVFPWDAKEFEGVFPKELVVVVPNAGVPPKGLGVDVVLVFTPTAGVEREEEREAKAFAVEPPLFPSPPLSSASRATTCRSTLRRARPS